MKKAQGKVVYEETLDRGFAEQVRQLPGGDKVETCIQCGTCSGSCPVSWAMQETPRKLFAMIRAGMRDEVLASATPWLCASCYECAVRCPQEIEITTVMYGLKRMAMRAGDRVEPAGRLSREFLRLVKATGRMHEATLMRRYLKPREMLAQIGVGWRLWSHGRLPIRGERIEDISGLQKIIARAQRLDE